MSEQKQQKSRRSGWYEAARVLVAVLTRTIIPITYHHVERMPQQGPFIMIANHTHWLDPILIAAPVKKAEVTFLGKKELVKGRLAQYLLPRMHMIVVDRHNSDMEAMRACIRALRNGEILGIFPEGTRHHQGTMTELESGVGLIALRANVPLVPVYLTSVRMFHRIHCYVGEAIDFSDLRAQGVNNDTCQQLLQRITETYARMMQEAGTM